MKNTKATYEQAIIVYTEYYGKAPTVTEINELYHGYANNWKKYDGFKDYVIYFEA